MQVAIDRINRLIYVADSGNHAIRTISMDDGAVATMIGTPDGEAGFNDGGCKDCSYCAVLLLLCFWFLVFFFFLRLCERACDPLTHKPPKTPEKTPRNFLRGSRSVRTGRRYTCLRAPCLHAQTRSPGSTRRARWRVL